MTFYDLLLRLYPASFRQRIRRRDARRSSRAQRRRASGLAVAGALAAHDRRRLVNAAGAHLDILKQDLSYTARMLRRAPGVRGHRGADRRARHRRDDRRVLGHRLRAAPAAAVPRARTARQALGEDARLLADGAVAAELSRLEARQRSRSRSMGMYHDDEATMIGAGEPRRLRGAAVSADLLSDARRRAALGRGVHRRRRSPRRRRARSSSATASGRPSSAATRRSSDRSAAARQRAVHGHRRDAARVPLPGERRRCSGRRSGSARRTTPIAAHEQLAQRRRPAAARRDARAGAGRDGRRRGAVRGAATRTRTRTPARRSFALGDEVSERSRLLLLALLGAAGLRAADRLRQPGESAARARARPAPRAGGPHGDRAPDASASSAS